MSHKHDLTTARFLGQSPTISVIWIDRRLRLDVVYFERDVASQQRSTALRDITALSEDRTMTVHNNAMNRFHDDVIVLDDDDPTRPSGRQRLTFAIVR